MSEKKHVKTENFSEKFSENKKVAPARRKKRPPSMLEPYMPSDRWRNFDRAFEWFRRDFENFLWPSAEMLLKSAVAEEDKRKTKKPRNTFEESTPRNPSQENDVFRNKV